MCSLIDLLMTLWLSELFYLRLLRFFFIRGLSSKYILVLFLACWNILAQILSLFLWTFE
jgi:hypothetical protein